MGTLLTPWKTWAGVLAFSFCSARTCTEPQSLAAVSAGSAGCPALAAPGFAPQVPLEEPPSPGQRRRCGSNRSKRETSPPLSPQLCLPIILSDELPLCHYCSLPLVLSLTPPLHHQHRSITSTAPSAPAHSSLPSHSLFAALQSRGWLSLWQGCKSRAVLGLSSALWQSPALGTAQRHAGRCQSAPDLFIHIHTHKNAAKCFLRGRWDQRAPLTYTILPFCQLLVNKIFQAGAGSSCSLGSTAHRSCSSPSPLLWHFTSQIHHNPDRTSKASCQGSTSGNPPIRKEIIAPA